MSGGGRAIPKKVLSVENLKKRYGKGEDSVRAIKGISLYEEKITDKSGSEKTKWKKSTWKGTTRGIIRNGYLYRISAGARLEDYEKAKKKYLSKILDSFAFKK